MREYETTYILNPSLTDAEVKTSIDRIGAIIGRHSGSIIRMQNMGKKNLAYRINKQSKGVYINLDYAADNTTVAEIEHILRLDEQVMRYLTVKVSDEVNVEQRKAELEKEAEELAKAMATMTQQRPMEDSFEEGEVPNV